MILYRTVDGLVVEQDGKFFALAEKTMDELLGREDLYGHVQGQTRVGHAADTLDAGKLLAPVGHQEIWAAGVTYLRSRAARMAESQDAGGGDFYDRVYTAERPELFFKAQGAKVVGPGGTVRLRSDATWSVPEPEMALVVNPRGKIVGTTIGNDMSSRDIEGQNPLYLPQAKVYDGSCALGPGILLGETPLAAETRIRLTIERGEAGAFAGETTLAQMKRTPEELVRFLYRDQTFPVGAVLLTGTGIVPPDSFTLEAGDVVRIAIDGIGELVNPVR